MHRTNITFQICKFFTNSFSSNYLGKTHIVFKTILAVQSKLNKYYSLPHPTMPYTVTYDSRIPSALERPKLHCRFFDIVILTFFWQNDPFWGGGNESFFHKIDISKTITARANPKTATESPWIALTMVC